MKTKEHLRNLTGLKVLRIKKTHGTVTGKNNREVGQFIIDGVGSVLLLNFSKAADLKEEGHDKLLKDQQQQLKLT